MGSDMVVALGQATVGQQTLLGINLFAEEPETVALQRVDRRTYTPDETVNLNGLKIPQVRQTYRILGLNQAGQWGFQFGANECAVAVGATPWRSRLAPVTEGIRGPDLVRLTLERAGSARQGVEVLKDFLERYQVRGDQVFLIADSRESFVIEAAGPHWALVECHQTRAVTEVGLIRQDWRRVSPGLAEYAIQEGWWRSDGSKLDFAAAIGDLQTPESTRGLRRWSKATLALAQQESRIDPYVMRQMLLEHFNQCQGMMEYRPFLLGSMVMQLSSYGEPVVAWYAPMHRGISLYFPLFVSAELPSAWNEGLHRWRGKPERLREMIDRLQAQFDQDAEEFLQKSKHLGREESSALTHALMASHAEHWEQECQGRRKTMTMPRPKRPQYQEMLDFVAE